MFIPPPLDFIAVFSSRPSSTPTHPHFSFVHQCPLPPFPRGFSVFAGERREREKKDAEEGQIDKCARGQEAEEEEREDGGLKVGGEGVGEEGGKESRSTDEIHWIFRCHLLLLLFFFAGPKARPGEKGGERTKSPTSLSDEREGCRRKSVGFCISFDSVFAGIKKMLFLLSAEALAELKERDFRPRRSDRLQKRARGSRPNRSRE